MDPRPIFLLQLVWFLLVWATLARFVVWPWSQRLSPAARLSVWVAPQMFRVLGLGLLVPNLSPAMPRDFALATAVGDSLTAGLALLAFVGLRCAWPAARALTWACTVVGTLDLTIAFLHAVRAEAAAHLAGQWYVPVLGVPLMVVAHVGCFVALVRGGTPRAS